MPAEPAAPPRVGERVPVRPGLFLDDVPPQLCCGRCLVCGRPHFPRQSVCPYCSAASVEDLLLGGTGRLWVHTAVTAAPPGYEGEVPFGFGVVELGAGLRVVTRLTEADPARLHSGQAMTLAVVPLHVDDEGRQVVTYAFAPDP